MLGKQIVVLITQCVHIREHTAVRQGVLGILPLTRLKNFISIRNVQLDHCSRCPDGCPL